MTEDEQTALKEAFLAADKTVRPKLRALMPPVTVEWGGLTFHLEPCDNYSDLQFWLHGAPVEIESLKAVRRLVQGRRAYVLDIGANSGTYTCPLAKAAGRGSRVVAFEPNPVMVGRLGRNVQANGLGDVVRVEAVALGEAEGEAHLRLKRGNLGQSSINPHSPAKGMTLTVAQRPLRTYLKGLSAYEVTLLKIDVEGAEAWVLGPWLDAALPEERPDAILIETAHPHLWNRDLVSDIKSFGYDVALQVEGNTLLLLSDGRT